MERTQKIENVVKAREKNCMNSDRQRKGERVRETEREKICLFIPIHTLQTSV